jgi:hypothetical protein
MAAIDWTCIEHDPNIRHRAHDPEILGQVVIYEEPIEDGWIAARETPAGMLLTVTPQLMGAALLTVAKPTTAKGTYDEAYTYPTLQGALVYMIAWSPDVEPYGWIRHIPSNRRRPGGDESREYILP